MDEVAATAAVAVTAAATAGSAAEGETEGRPDGERKRRRRRRRGRGGSREARETTGSAAGAGPEAEAAEGSAPADHASGDGSADSSDAISTADTQPLPILATAPGLPMAYEPPGLPVVAGERDTHSETVTLAAQDAIVPPAAIPEHPGESVAQDSAPLQAEAGQSVPDEPVKRVDVEDSTGTEQAPEQPAEATAEIPGVQDIGESLEEAEPVQRYTVWSSGPGGSSHHFGPKDD